MEVERLVTETAQDLVSNVDHFLVDVDGVLWDLNGSIKGSRQAVEFLKAKNKKVYYVSNNNTYTQEEFVAKFERYGYDVQKDEVFSTAHVSALYLKSTGFQGTVYVVGTASIGKELDRFGISHTGIGPDVEGIEREDRETWVDAALDPGVTSVLVGFDNYFNTNKILKAASYLQRKGSLFLATGEDTGLPGCKDLVIPDNGAMVAAVKVMAKREPVVLGKPHKLFFELLQKHLDLNPSRCCVVGDGLTADIGLARAIGSKSLLVLTGVTTQTDVDQLTSGEWDLPRPDYFTDSFGDLCTLLSET